MTRSSWLRSAFGHPVTRPIRKAPAGGRLALEVLEDRVTPTVYLGTEPEPNNSVATATVLTGPDVKITGNIVPSGDVDFYSFTAQAGDRVSAAVMTSWSSNGSVDSRLELLDSDGSTVLEIDNDDGSFGTTSSSIAGAPIAAAGTYYLRVTHAVAATQLRPYELWVRVQSGSPTAETEPNDTSPGQALPAGGWVSGDTSSATDVDRYSLTLNAGDSVFLSLDLDPERDGVEWNGALGLSSFGTPPGPIIINDAGTSTPDSEALFLTVKDAGTYEIFVGTNGGVTFGTYHLSVSVLPASTAPSTTYTSTDVPVTIPTGPGVVSSTITIPDDKRIGQLKVAINLTHNFMADLDVTLTAPDGNTVGLFTDIGSSTAGAQTGMDLILDDDAAIPIGQFPIVSGLVFKPEGGSSGYRLEWFKGQQTQGTWTLTIRDDAAADGGTLNGWSLIVVDEPPLPAGTRQTIFSTDFEADDGGFTHSGTADEWERGTPTADPITTANSGVNAWKTDLDNTYENNSNQDLFSPDIDLTAAGSRPLLLEWAMKFQLERPDFDRAFVEVQEVGGAGLTRKVWEWLGPDMILTVGNPSTTIQEAAGWGRYRAAIDDFAGKTIRLRFHLETDSSVQRAGLAIDDVSVSFFNQPPVVTAGQSFTVAENTANGTSVGTAAATDPDTGTTFQNWAITGGTGATAFAINPSTGAITVADAAQLDREAVASFTLLVTVSDGADTSAAETITINLSDVNDVTPVVTAGQSFSVAENTANGTAVGTVAATDGDVTATTFQSWTITGGTGATAFAINPGTGAITVADASQLDFEATTSFTLLVTVSDGVNTSAAQSVTINLTDVNEAATGRYAVGSAAGSSALVGVFDDAGNHLFDLTPFGTYQGAARVGSGDVTGDGVEDIVVGAGPGAPGGHVKVFDGVTGAELHSFFAFEGYVGGVFVSAGDVNADGFADLMAVAGRGGNGHVKVFDGRSGALLASFLSFPGTLGKVQGTLADLDGDGMAEVLVASAGEVRAFSLDGTERFRFNPYAGYTAALSLAAGDLDGDGIDEILTGAEVNGHVKVFANQRERFSFLAYPGYLGGVRVASADVNDDGRDDVLTAPFDSAHLKAFSGTDLALLDSFFALQRQGGVFVG